VSYIYMLVYVCNINFCCGRRIWGRKVHTCMHIYIHTCNFLWPGTCVSHTYMLVYVHNVNWGCYHGHWVGSDHVSYLYVCVCMQHNPELLQAHSGKKGAQIHAYIHTYMLVYVRNINVCYCMHIYTHICL
jgi:hypothetical protein